MKHGSRVRLTEADFITKNTTIDILGVRRYIHIVQEYIDATVLADMWNQMGLYDRKSSMCQLRGYLNSCVLLLLQN